MHDHDSNVVTKPTQEPHQRRRSVSVEGRFAESRDDDNTLNPKRRLRPALPGRGYSPVHFLVRLVPFVDAVPVYNIPVAAGQDTPKIIGTYGRQTGAGLSCSSTARLTMKQTRPSQARGENKTLQPATHNWLVRFSISPISPSSCAKEYGAPISL